MTELDIIFTAYLMRSNKNKTLLAEHLNVSRKTLSKMWSQGVETWRWAEVIKAARYLGIPIDVLREQVTYRKENKT